MIEMCSTLIINNETNTRLLKFSKIDDISNILRESDQHAVDLVQSKLVTMGFSTYLHGYALNKYITDGKKADYKFVNLAAVGDKFWVDHLTPQLVVDPYLDMFNNGTVHFYIMPDRMHKYSGHPFSKFHLFNTFDNRKEHGRIDLTLIPESVWGYRVK